MSNNNYPTYLDWEVVDEIGSGSFGTVYKIRQKIGNHIEYAALKVVTIPESDKEIKKLRKEYDDSHITQHFAKYKDSVVSEYSVQRSLVDEPNVVRCEEIRCVQHDDGIGWDVFIRMEPLTPLDDFVSATYCEENVIRLGVDLCNALVACEQQNLVHRDIKPQNIFVSPKGVYKLGDFGVAKVKDKTATGTKTGTFEYMAPEVYNNLPYHKSPDIYSLGLVMYWMMNGKRTPFLPLNRIPPTAEEKETARAKRFSGEPLPEPKYGSRKLKRIVMKACAFDPKDRYQSATELRAELLNVDVELSKTIGFWSPEIQIPSVIETIPEIEPGIEDKPVSNVEDIATPTENEDKTVGMWAAIEAEREWKRKEAEEAERQRKEAEAKRLADEAAEKERLHLLEEQRIRDEKAAELKRLKELEEKKRRDEEEAERIRKLDEEKKRQENIKKKILPILAISVVIAIGVWISSITKEPEVIVVTPTPYVQNDMTVTATPTPVIEYEEDDEVAAMREIVQNSSLSKKPSQYYDQVIQYVVTTEKGIFRSGPYTDYRKIGNVFRGEIVYAYADTNGQFGKWYLIQAASGGIGWISEDIVEMSN